MFIKDFNQNNQERIASLQKTLKEEFGVAFVQKFPTEDKLKLLKDSANQKIVSIKGSSQKFQLEPEYIKYLNIRDLSATMLSEGMYAESPKYMEMKDSLMASVQNLMDSGYTMDEASSECMNRYRMDPRFAFDDEHVKTIILKAAKDYMESCGSKYEAVEELVQEADTELNEYLLRELAKEVGMELEDVACLDAIEEKLNLFAEVSGKSRDAVVGFLNELDEDKVESGIRYFGGQIAFENKKKDHDGDGDIDSDDYLAARDKAIKKAIKKREDANESMFDDIIDEMISEEIEGTTVDEAEVVMAIKTLTNDIQDQVERLGRMKNEDIPAIADSMVSEFGLEKAQGFKEQAESILDDALQSSKGSKEGIDGLIGNITGVGSLGGSDLEADEPMGLDEPGGVDPMADEPGGVDPMAEPDMDVNEPAAAGPEDEPLGRAPVEV